MDTSPTASAPSVILHTYQQQLLPTSSDAYGISVSAAPLITSQNDIFTANPASFAWASPTFAAATYPETQFGTDLSVLNYPELTSIFDDPASDPSLHGGSNSSSSTSDVGSSVDCSISPEPILMPSVKRGRPTENPCWSYFHRIDDQLVKCRICTKVVRSACATNMTKHLERHHAEDFEKVAGQIKLCRANDPAIRSKMQYAAAETPLTPTPVPPNPTCYIVPKRFDGASQYYTIEESSQQSQSQPFIQFEPQDAIAQWPLSNFWSNGMAVHLEEPSTSAIGTSVIQKTNPSDVLLQQQGQVVIVQQPLKGGGVKLVKTVNGVEKPYMKRNRKTEHPVWEFFKRTGDGNAECNICRGVVKSPCSSNFMRHLMRHHSPEYNDVYLKWIQKRNITHPGMQYTSVPPPNNPQFELKTEPIQT